MADENKRTGIKVHGKGNTVSGNKVVGGFGTAYDISGESNKVKDNLAATTTPPPPAPPAQQPTKPSFWFHPITKTVLYIAGVVVAAALVWVFGFK